jgi:hypothetical protein
MIRGGSKRTKVTPTEIHYLSTSLELTDEQTQDHPCREHDVNGEEEEGGAWLWE